MECRKDTDTIDEIQMAYEYAIALFQEITTSPTSLCIIPNKASAICPSIRELLVNVKVCEFKYTFQVGFPTQINSKDLCTTNLVQSSFPS
jgi:hypothetical protein